VVLKDVAVAKAESGKDYIKIQEQKKLQNGYTTEAKIEAHAKN
jgi:3-hydroxyacyl-CoA dehydrogenase/enoyl-CoA hydratase/3-hydroxybutyryl-CoA epimerase